MQLEIKDFSATPEEGELLANLKVTNFNDPEIDFKINTSFKLDFLADFFNLTEMSDLSGAVDLEMNFHDIINIDEPQHVIARLNESYKTKLKITNLKFNYGEAIPPVHNLNLYAEMKGHEAVIDYCDLEIGESDLSVRGKISDLPAIIHHTNKTVSTKLKIASKSLNLFELTGGDSLAVNEQISNLKLNLAFKSSAQELAEFTNLPKGEFFVQNLNAKLQNYPHELHDFHADVIIDEEDFRVLDFKGMVDESDFLLYGKLKHYDVWFQDTLKGETEIDFDFKANKLRLEDLLSYNGENYVPEEYRYEEIDDLKFHGNTQIHFNDSLEYINLTLNHFQGKMKIHPLKLEKFNGKVHYEEEHLVVDEFSGQLGDSDVKTSLHYYLGSNEALKKRSNYFSLKSTYLDIDELVNYNELPSEDTHVENHDSVFNIYTLPFTDMSFFVDIKKLNYHQYTITNFYGKLHTTPNHYMYIDTVSAELAGGRIVTKGYFNGSNPNAIYFSPKMNIHKINLDKLLLKFDNFGQDHVVAENLHGEFTGTLTGKVHMHTDMVPILDDSEIHLQAHIENGRLENYEVLQDFSEYFYGQNIESVRFDTLENTMDIVKGKIILPKMTINSTLGFFEVSGEQDTDYNFEYTISIPLKIVTKAVASKLFKRKDNTINEPSEIQYGTNKTKFVTIQIKGDSTDYNVSLTKRKK